MTPYLEGLVKEARADYAAGKTSGPFSNVEDLMKHLSHQYIKIATTEYEKLSLS